MALDPARLLARTFEPVAQTYAAKDSILYALSCGLGSDPLDERQLRYVYERVTGGLQTLPTMANVLGYSGFWADQPDTGITWSKLVHAEQSIQLHRPLPASASIVGQTRVVGLHDKGLGKGALMLQERRITDAATGVLMATITQTTMLRADGGFGRDHGDAHGMTLPISHKVPDRAPDLICDQPTLPQMALLYRLNGDANPLHADPAVAKSAGFSRPILHGLATMGVALHAALATALEYESSKIQAMRVRFTAPVLPGETLRTELWRDGSVVSLRMKAVERGGVVLTSGCLDLVEVSPAA